MEGPSLIADLHQEMAKTRELLRSLPDDDLDFRPHERSWNLGELAAHIANLPAWLRLTLETDELDLAEPMEAPPPPTSGAEVAARFEESLGSALRALEGAGPETFSEPWTLRMGDQVMFAMPRVSVIRGMILNHMIHHRGQLTVYLRMVDGTVPGLYGPSADDPR